jgi:tRNA 2-(methylsulfanyl)-N6-isopentenyladenosine37 hydroxylase
MILHSSSSPAWLDAVLGDFDAFSADHAACERKASGTAMAFLSHYPDRPELVSACASLAVEELGHFRDVTARILARGRTLGPDRRDPYVRRLASLYRSGRDEYLIDRLVVASIVEARGCERLALVGSAHSDEDTRSFYRGLARSEARHQDLYADLARVYGEPGEVQRRTEELLAAEASLLAELPPVPALFAAGSE